MADSEVLETKFYVMRGSGYPYAAPVHEGCKSRQTKHTLS